MKEAHIRFSTRQEAGSWFFRPIVCVFDGQICYRRKSRWFSFEIEDVETGVTLTSEAALGSWGKDVYRLPDGRSLSVEATSEGWLFDGECVRESWPTPRKRILSCGERKFRVHPIDDTLLFDVDGDKPDPISVIMGFCILRGSPAGGG